MPWKRSGEVDGLPMHPHLSRERPPGRTIVVGDIHGCGDEFDELLDLLGFGADDLVISVGDMIDRGPDSWGVARFFRDTPNAQAVLGNHERRLARFVLGQAEPAWSQRHALSRLPAEVHEDWAAWLLELPAVVSTPDAIVTHARLDPGVPLDDQEARHTCAVGGYATRIAMDDDGVPLWIRDLADPRPVCMGHIVYPRVELVPRRLYALDTGCCRAGRLTALVLPDHGIVSVASRHHHERRSRAEWEMAQYHDLDAMPLVRLLLLQGELGDWEAGPRRTHVEHALTTLLDGLDLTRRLTEAKPRLEETFGTAPPPSPERGRYLAGVGAAQESELAGFLARMSLGGKRLGYSHLARYLALETAADLVRIIGDLGTTKPHTADRETE